MYKTCILYTDIHCTWLCCRQMDNNKINSLTFLIFLSISLCLNFFHLLVQKPNLEKNSIHSNKFFIIFTCLNPVLLVRGFGQVGYTNTAVFRKIYLKRFFSKVPIPILVRIQFIKKEVLYPLIVIICSAFYSFSYRRQL